MVENLLKLNLIHIFDNAPFIGEDFIAEEHLQAKGHILGENIETR